ncbi:hypothetical protein [Rubinisphaera sp.]|uniref:hypothetical protein n=1 Tax=Rubinisphaera sp. TaxID=2024857 RepID=UPI000C0DFD4B|nr:hypothetical protein [Rubinisphaera sp.]MBV08353.1 hypothetical protein [Rubinisphaera sp.]|tara:strand:+ start:753 stop:1004 length:252 start_codon:yes stop_codon:yes gene_type:complete
MSHTIALTSETIQDFTEFAKSRLQSQSSESLQDCFTVFCEIQELKQALAEISTLHEAAAGCGYSRNELEAQYQARLDRLLNNP